MTDDQTDAAKLKAAQDDADETVLNMNFDEMLSRHAAPKKRSAVDDHVSSSPVHVKQCSVDDHVTQHVAAKPPRATTPQTSVHRAQRTYARNTR